MVGRGRRPPFFQRPPRRSSTQSKPSQYRELLRKKAWGKCFKCLDPRHRIAACTNLPRCLLCGEAGHKARWCASKAPTSAPTSPAQAPAPLPPPPPGPPPPWAVRAPMEAPAADVEIRRGLVVASAGRSASLAEAERRLSRCGVVAVIVGSHPGIGLAAVKQAMAQRFRIQPDAVKVSLRALGEYLLIFDDARVRDTAISFQGPLAIGRVSFLLSPWSRFCRASPSKMLFKVRVCLEGVPEHAWDVESVRTLFDPSVIIDGIDTEVRSEEETGCFRLWVWMDDVQKLKTRGVLQLEEPREIGSPGTHFPEFGILDETPERWGQVGLLGHPVLIHLDRVVDFRYPPDSSSDSGRSSSSDISGMPSEVSSSTPWPTRWGYRWFLNYEDGDFPPLPSRAPAHLRFPGQDGDGGDGADRSSWVVS